VSPKTLPKKVLILGSGGLKIGQAGEFDYSGSQAIKALKEAAIQIILVNPNIATVQTDMADGVYLQPLHYATVSEILKQEQPDGLLLGFGGQTALNLGLELADSGLLDQLNIAVLGSSIDAIRQTEDRALFKQALDRIKIKTPVSYAAKTVESALAAAEKIGYPVMLRAGFSLGGLGSGQVTDSVILQQRVQQSLAGAPQVLIEEYLAGWKEFEYEIVRDHTGQSLVICTMENFDPMGIHTGESIVVAPAQTLTNTAHQQLRHIALQIADHFNIIGECNLQFAVNPQNGDYRVIEMNARLSRSSALASKATGYPLAFIAAKLALGYRLHELPNPVTRVTCAFVEPALDYIVVKIPRWDLLKFRDADREIGTEMKSVGEVMAIGRSFPEALQKAVSMLNIGASCLADYPWPIPDLKADIQTPTDRRLFALYAFFKAGGSLEEAHSLSKIDRWFLQPIQKIAQFEIQLESQNIACNTYFAEGLLTPARLKQAKQLGFSDRYLARMTGQTEATLRCFRLQHHITPWVKQIDTLAGEYKAHTRYLYLTYQADTHDVLADTSKQAPILILGSGPYTIGSSVEFDWCLVNTERTLRQLGEKTVMINLNPETVSTDYDESDRLYFEPLTLESIQDIADLEKPRGIIVSAGGQIANNVALPLAQAGYPILGTAPECIDRAENREKFSQLLTRLGIAQPTWKRVKSLDEAHDFVKQIGYPLLIRPSYILSGAAMSIVYTPEALEKCLDLAFQLSPEAPVVISQFVTEAKELEIDGVAERGRIVIQAISEHIENAGVHSGDATLVLPPQKLYLETIRQTKRLAAQIVQALAITGPFNIQFIAKNNAIQVIECNLRASRAFPFVSKVTGYNFIRIASEILVGRYQTAHYETLELDHVGVKAAQFSYHRIKGANPVAHVEMASTGEVACLADNLLEAFWQAWLATDQTISTKTLLLSIADSYKTRLLPFIQPLEAQDWKFFSTEGTHRFLSQQGIPSYFTYKAGELAQPNIQTLIAERKIGLIINIPSPNPRQLQLKNRQATEGFVIRRLAIDHHIPLVTNPQSAQILLEALAKWYGKNPKLLPWKTFLSKKPYDKSFL
jgi:carbamoyl-phosphate synthase large subunit